MGKKKYVGETITLNDHRLDTVKNLIRRLVELDQTKKVKYLKNISSREIEIIEEILVNVIKDNIPHNIKVFKLLKRVKKTYVLSNLE